MGNDNQPSDPFDEKYLAVGEDFEFEGELIAVHQHTGVAEPEYGLNGGGSEGGGA